MNEKYSVFNKWYEKFSTNAEFIVNKSWFDRVQKSHQKLRNIIGGVSLSKDVLLPSDIRIVNAANARANIRTLLHYFPELTNFITEDKLLFPTVEINKKKIKTSKAILTWWENTYESTDKNTNYQNSKWGVNNQISHLGRIWLSDLSKDLAVNVTLTTEAKAFAMIGNYGSCDSGSCFRNGLENECHKYLLGQNKNTFVVLVSIKDKVICRYWGFYSNNQFHLCNRYGNDVEQDDIMFALKLFFSKFFSIPVEKIVYSDDKTDIEGEICYNGDDYCFSNHEIKYKALNINEYNLIKHCQQCDSIRTILTKVDDDQICDRCLEEAGYCEYSKKNTLDNLLYVINKDGKTISVAEKYIDDIFIPCDHCCEYFHKDILKKIMSYGCAEYYCKKCSKVESLAA